MHGVLNVRAIFFSLILVKRKKQTKKEWDFFVSVLKELSVVLSVLCSRMFIISTTSCIISQPAEHAHLESSCQISWKHKICRRMHS